jgi:anti-sigma factor RsiW
MCHPDQETLQRFADGETAGTDANALVAHIRACASCSQAIQELQHEDARIASLLSTLDSPPPVLHLLRPPGRRQVAAPWIRRAATLLFLASLAGAGWAMPGSPVRSWLRGSMRQSTPAGMSNVIEDAAPALHGGLDIPVDGAVLITFAQAQARGSVRIVLSDSAGVRLTILNHDARLESPSEHHVIIENDGSLADYRIRVPRSAADVTVRVGSRVVFRMMRDVLTSSIAQSGDGSYVVPLGSAGS